MGRAQGAIARYESTQAEPELVAALKELDNGPAGGGPIYTAIPVATADSPYSVVPKTTTHVVLLIDTTAGPVTILCPPNPTLGEVFTATDLGGAAISGNSITIDGNGNDVQGSPTLTFPFGIRPTDFNSYTFMFTGAQGGWRIIWTYAPAGGAPPG